MVLGTKAEGEKARKAGRRSGATQVETLSNVYDFALFSLLLHRGIKGFYCFFKQTQPNKGPKS